MLGFSGTKGDPQGDLHREPYLRDAISEFKRKKLLEGEHRCIETRGIEVRLLDNTAGRLNAESRPLATSLAPRE